MSGLLDVLPGLSSSSSLHCVFADAILAGNGSNGLSTPPPESQISYETIRQHGLRRRFSASVPSLLDHIAAIVGSCSEKQMIGAYTAAHIAVVTDKEASGNRPIGDLPHDTICDDVDTVIGGVEVAVATLSECASPQPTRIGFVNMRPETLLKCHPLRDVLGIAVGVGLHAVARTHTVAARLIRTACDRARSELRLTLIQRIAVSIPAEIVRVAHATIAGVLCGTSIDDAVHGTSVAH